MKLILIALLALIPTLARSQSYYTYRVTIRCMGERVEFEKEYEIIREGQFVYFSSARIGGTEGFALKIIDSTRTGTFVLDRHWMTTFDSLQITKDRVRLFNRTLDDITYNR